MDSDLKKAFYITTPIYYVNADPHIGSAYTTVCCDMMARFKRLDDYQVHFLSGTDEHGQKVEKAAKDKGIDPQTFVDNISDRFRSLVKTVDASCDDFIRTTEDRHKKGAQHFWNILLEKGDIYLDGYEGWYSVRDEAFYTEDELVDGKAPTGAEVEWLKEPSYFFKLSKYQDKLLDFFEKNPDFIQPSSRRNEVISFVKSGLKDLSISRTSFKWGVNVPNDPDHVMYVWMDALTNYLTALGYPNDTESMETLWPEARHIVGKDILRFHCIYWPAFLMAADLPLPKAVFAHGWWTVEGEKMSKSLGNVVDPFDLIETYGVDAVRYFLLRGISFGQDGDFSKETFISRLNSDLANALGNLVQRTLSFVYKQCDGKIPQKGTLQEQDEALIKQAKDLLDTLRSDIDGFSLHRYGEHLWGLIYEANRYIDEEAPWSLKKTDRNRMESVLYTLCEVIRIIALYAQPILTKGSQKILDMLNIQDRSFKAIDIPVKEGIDIEKPEGIYPRIQEDS